MEATTPGWRALLLPDNLRPPAPSEFWRRYVVLGIITAAWAALQVTFFLWFRWDVDRLTVTTFGFVTTWGGSAQDLVGFERFVNLMVRWELGALNLAFIAAAALAWGWPRIRESIAAASFRKTAGYALAGAAVFILGDWAFEHARLYSGDPTLRQKPTLGLFLSGLASIGIIGPVAEEVAVRFTLYQFLRTKLAFPWAALISSAAFGLMHFGYPDPMKMAMCLAGGWVLAWTYERTGSILAPVGVHVLNNGFMQAMAAI